MKVKDLMAMLRAAEPESTVLIVSQYSRPVECEIFKIVRRSEMLSAADEERGPRVRNTHAGDQDAALTDTLIVQGDELRDGDMMAWSRP